MIKWTQYLGQRIKLSVKLSLTITLHANLVLSLKLFNASSNSYSYSFIGLVSSYFYLSDYFGIMSTWHWPHPRLPSQLSLMWILLSCKAFNNVIPFFNIKVLIFPSFSTFNLTEIFLEV